MNALGLLILALGAGVQPTDAEASAPAMEAAGEVEIPLVKITTDMLIPGQPDSAKSTAGGVVEVEWPDTEQLVIRDGKLVHERKQTDEGHEHE